MPTSLDLPIDGREVGGVDGLQLVLVRITHGTQPDYTCQTGCQGIPAKTGRGVHGPYNLYSLHTNPLQVLFIESIVGHQL